MSDYEKEINTSKGYTAPIENNEYAQIFALIKDIYTSRDLNGREKPKYYVSNEEMSMAARNVADTFTLDSVKEFYEDVKSKGMLGARRSWHLNAPLEDLRKFYAKDLKKLERPLDRVRDLDDAGRYLHLIYMPNRVNYDVLDDNPNPKVMALRDAMLAKYGPKAVEVLMDWGIWHRTLGKMGMWTHLSVEKNILEAIKWTQEHPDEYNRAVETSKL